LQITSEDNFFRKGLIYLAIESYEQLGAMEIDVLTEVGNIGSGNAVTAFSAMIGRAVDIQVPAVKLLDFQTAIDFAGGAEKLVAGILVQISGDIEGMMLFLLEQDMVDLIVSTFFGQNTISLLELTPDMSSALTETGNIMSGSYVNAIAELAQMKINVGVPMMCVDMIGAIMSVPVSIIGEMSDKLLFIDSYLIIDGSEIKSKMMLLPTVNSLDTLLKKLGVTA